MQPLFIALLFIGSFMLGYFISQKINRHVNLDEKCRKTLKNQKDVINWLRSELSQVKNSKLDKRNIDQRKIKLIELIIKRLER